MNKRSGQFESLSSNTEEMNSNWSDDQLRSLIDSYFKELDEFDRSTREQGRRANEIIAQFGKARDIDVVESRRLEWQEKLKRVDSDLSGIEITDFPEDWCNHLNRIEHILKKIYASKFILKYLKENLHHLSEDDREEYTEKLLGLEEKVDSLWSQYETLETKNTHEELLKKVLLGDYQELYEIMSQDNLSEGAIVVNEGDEETLIVKGNFKRIGINEFAEFGSGGRIQRLAKLVSEYGIKSSGENENGYFHQLVIDLIGEMQNNELNPLRKLENLVSFTVISFNPNIEVGRGLLPDSPWLYDTRLDDYYNLLANFLDDDSAKLIAEYFANGDALLEEDHDILLPILRAVERIEARQWQEMIKKIREKALGDDVARARIYNTESPITFHDYAIIAHLTDPELPDIEKFQLKEIEYFVQALRQLDPEDIPRLKIMMHRSEGKVCKFFTDEVEPSQILDNLENYGEDLYNLINRFTDIQEKITLFVRDLTNEYTQLALNYDAVLAQLQGRLENKRLDIAKGHLKIGDLDAEFEQASLLGGIFKTAFSENPNLNFEDLHGLSLDVVIGSSISDEDKDDMLEIFNSNWTEAPNEVMLTFREKLERALDDDDEFYLLRKDSKIIGFLRFHTIDRGRVNATSFNISPNYRGSKIGETFMKETIEKVASESIIIADSRVENPALGMYINRMSFTGIELFGIIDKNGKPDHQLVLERKPDTQEYLAELSNDQFGQYVLDLSIEQDIHELEDILHSEMIIEWHRDGKYTSIKTAPKPQSLQIAAK